MPIDPTTIRKIAEAYTAAWNSGSPEAVAKFFAEDGRIAINRGEAWMGRDGVASMAAGFFADVPDLRLMCDDVRCSGNHVLYAWTFRGTHAGSKKRVSVSGWEEWELDREGKVTSSLGWYDAQDYARQTSTG